MGTRTEQRTKYNVTLRITTSNFEAYESIKSRQKRNVFYFWKSFHVLRKFVFIVQWEKKKRERECLEQEKFIAYKKFLNSIILKSYYC